MRDLRAESVMVKPVVCTRETTPARDIVLALLGGHFSGVPVTDNENRVVGVITEFDLLKALKEGKDLAETAVGALMSKKAITADVNVPLSEIVDIMTDANIHRLPITKDGRLVGVVARPDILKSQIDPSIFVL